MTLSPLDTLVLYTTVLLLKMMLFQLFNKLYFEDSLDIMYEIYRYLYV